MTSYLQAKAQAAYKSADDAYTQAIGTRMCFEQLLDGIPVDDVEFYNQVWVWHEEAVQCITAAWKAKLAAEQALEAVQGK